MQGGGGLCNLRYFCCGVGICTAPKSLRPGPLSHQGAVTVLCNQQKNRHPTAAALLFKHSPGSKNFQPRSCFELPLSPNNQRREEKTKENVRIRQHKRRSCRQRTCERNPALSPAEREAEAEAASTMLIHPSIVQGGHHRTNPYQPVGDFLSNLGRFKIIESTLRGQIPFQHLRSFNHSLDDSFIQSINQSPRSSWSCY